MQSSSRNGARVRVLAVHTSEGNDRPTIDDAAALRDASWWTGSSHAIADDDPGSLLTPAEGCVSYERASWTLRSGNPWSENIELIGWAHWTRAEWLARPRLLDRCAYWLAVRSKARGIPLVKLTPQQYRAGQSGVIGHVDHTIGYSDGTHWDPGPGFPWDVVLAKANAYRNGTVQEDDLMSALDEPITKPDGSTTTLRQVIAWSDANIDGTRALIREQTAAVVNALLDTEIDREDLGLRPTTLRQILRWSDPNTDRILNSVAAATAAASDADPQKVAEQVRAAVAGELSGLRITVAPAD